MLLNNRLEVSRYKRRLICVELPLTVNQILFFIFDVDLCGLWATSCPQLP